MPTAPRLLVTGSRHHKWSAVDTIALLTAAQDINRMRSQRTPLMPWELPLLVHGGAKGADTGASVVACRMGWLEEVHYAEWNRLGRAAGPIRNRTMVNRGADLCLAFPDHIRGKGSYGTWGCVDLAYEAGIPVLVVWKNRLWTYDIPLHDIDKMTFQSAIALDLPFGSSRTLV